MTTVSRHRPLARRGGALVLSILMLVAMTGLGLLAVTGARLEVSVAGNFRTVRQAQYIAEAGLVAAGAKIQEQAASFARRIQEQQKAGWPDPDGLLVLEEPEGEVYHYFQHEAGDAKNRTMGYDERPIGFEVWMEDFRDLASCPGVGAGAMCCAKVALVSEGWIGVFDDSGLPLEGTTSGKRRVRAEYVVPYPCSR